MSRAVRWQRASLPTRALLLFGVVVAVLLMHSVVTHGASMPVVDDAPAPSTSTSTAAAHTGCHGGTEHRDAQLAPATDSVRQHFSASDDCAAHVHPCVFVRADMPMLLLVVLALLWWGFPSVRRPAAQWLSRIVELGRPPPWAMRSHLDLQVIRC